MADLGITWAVWKIPVMGERPDLAGKAIVPDVLEQAIPHLCR